MLKSDMFDTRDWMQFRLIFFNIFTTTSFFLWFQVMLLPLITGTCIATPSPEISYKTCFALNLRLAITGLLLFFGGPYFIANLKLPNRFKIMNPSFVASDYICKFILEIF